MKRWMAVLLATLLAMMSLGATAQEITSQGFAPEIVMPEEEIGVQAEPVEPLVTAVYGARTAEEAYEELIVGVTTTPNGDFFTDMWGNNTTDIDVRSLIHGYDMMSWRAAEGMFAMDDSVVTGISATLDAAGNKTYAIYLAEDMLYSDGTPITAADYAFSMLLTMAPQMSEIGAVQGKSGYILGADAYARGEAQTISGVRLVSTYQLSVTISADYLPFFYELALLDFSPYPIAVIAPGCEMADEGAGAFIRNIDQAIEEPIFTAELLRETILNSETGYRTHPTVVSGPYVLTEYDAQAGSASFEVNSFYKGNADGQIPTIERLTLKTVARDEMLGQLERGEVDLLNKVVAADTIAGGLQMSTTNAARSSNYLRSGLLMMSFACEKGPTQFEKVRQAVALCTDKAALTAGYVGDYGMQVYGYYGLGQWMVQLMNGTIPPPVTALAQAPTAEQTAAYEMETAAWQALTLESLDKYELDEARAKALLIEDGWVLNAQGEAFDEANDDLRYKDVNGEKMELSLTLVVPQGNQAAALMDAALGQHLKAVGARLTVEEMPFAQLLRQYYRAEPRDADMFYLATNFVAVFDPSGTYGTQDAQQGVLNTTGLRDAELEQLAIDMRKTAEGDVLAYCQKWMAFEMRWNALMPAVPIYSNIYFDFYTPRLQNYQIGAHESWAKAVVYAYLSDAPDEPEPVEADAPMQDGDVITIE